MVTLGIIIFYKTQNVFPQFGVTGVTAPPIALTIRQLKRDSKSKFAVICCHTYDSGVW